MKIRFILAIVALLAVSIAVADDEGSGNSVAWDSLSEDQQEVLGRFEVDWSGLTVERQERLASGAVPS